jgi:hypothetical protein
MSLFAPTISNPHKLIIRQLFDEVWTNADFTNIRDLLRDPFNYHFRGETVCRAPEDLATIIRGWKESFPDLSFEVDGIVAERNQAAARIVMRGTQEKEWKGIEAGGHTVEVHEMMFFRFEGERIAEVWEVLDEHALLGQLTGDPREDSESDGN